MIRVTGQGTVIDLAEKKACRRFPRPAIFRRIRDCMKESRPGLRLFNCVTLVQNHPFDPEPEKAAEWRAKLPTEQDAVASDPPADEKQDE